jgi:hypothetical protein
MIPGVRNAAGVAIGLIGTAIALVLLGSGLTGTEPAPVPPPVEAVALSALQMLGSGAALGGVLVAGRMVSPWAPLTSGLLWAVGSVATLADPAAFAGEGLESAAIVFGRQFGLGLTALMLLGAVALRSARQEQARPVPGPADPAPPSLPPAAVVRAGPVRSQGPGPRHRAPARWSPPISPRRPDPRMRRPG